MSRIAAFLIESSTMGTRRGAQWSSISLRMQPVSRAHPRRPASVPPSRGPAPRPPPAPALAGSEVCRSGPPSSAPSQESHGWRRRAQSPVERPLPAALVRFPQSGWPRLLPADQQVASLEIVLPGLRAAAPLPFRRRGCLPLDTLDRGL